MGEEESGVEGGMNEEAEKEKKMGGHQSLWVNVNQISVTYFLLLKQCNGEIFGKISNDRILAHDNDIYI